LRREEKTKRPHFSRTNRYIFHRKVDTAETYLKCLDAFSLNNTKVSTFYNKVAGMKEYETDEIKNV